MASVSSDPGRWRRAEPVRGIDALAFEGFNRGARSYEAARPSYAREAVAWTCRQLGIEAGSRVLDLGAGTGKLALVVRELSGADVIAVEPVPAMREIAAGHGFDVRDGTAERVPLEAAAVDSVLCGEAFHWFDGERALAEIARVLRPGGGIGLLWNVHAWDRDADWVRAIERLLAPHSDGRAETRYGSGLWRAAFLADHRWSDLQQRSFWHEQRLDAGGLIDHVGSVAFIAALPDRERAAVLDEVGRIADRHEGDLTIRYRTDAYVSTLVDGVSLR